MPKHTNFMRATIWTPEMRMSCEGPPAGVIEIAFDALCLRPQTRATLLAALAEAHKRQLAWESQYPDRLIEKAPTP